MPVPPAYVTSLPAMVQSAPFEAGWLPLEHFRSAAGDDFYTSGPAEVGAVRASGGYADLGVAGYVYTFPGEGGQVPLLRFYSPSLGRHFFTPFSQDAPKPGTPAVDGTLSAGAGWVSEGVAGWLVHGAVAPPGMTTLTSTFTVRGAGGAVGVSVVVVRVLRPAATPAASPSALTVTGATTAAQSAP